MRLIPPCCALAISVGAAAAPAQPPPPEPALVLAEGSVASREMVAVGRDLVIEGEARSDVAVLRGDVTVRGSVDGDVIALGGRIRVESSGRIGGDAQALGGRVELDPGAEVAGRIAAYPRLHSSLLALFDGPALGVGWRSPPLLLLKLGLAAAWVLWAALCAVFAGRALRRTALSYSVGALRLFAVGLGVVLTSTLAMVVVTALLPLTAGLPLLLLVGLLLLGLKLWGVAALGLTLGRALQSRLTASMPLVLGPAVIGMLALNLLRFLPVLGVVAWAAFSLVGVGAAVVGRQWSVSSSQ